jgi:hypothetical protein
MIKKDELALYFLLGDIVETKKKTAGSITAALI